MSTYFETHTADEIIDKAWNFVPKGIPDSKNQINNFKIGMDKASQKEGNSDSTKSRIKEGYDYIKKWKKRYFIGSWKLLIISILATSWYVYQVYQRYQQGLPLLDFEEAAEYSFLYYIFAFSFLLGVIGYYWSQKAPAWMIVSKGLEKGHEILEKWDEEMSASKRPVNYTEYYDKSGRKIGDDQMTAEGTDMIVSSILWVVKIIIMWIAIPIVSIVGFFRYYVFYI